MASPPHYECVDNLPTIYVASRASNPARPAMWKALREEGANIISSWIDLAGQPDEVIDFGALWITLTDEIAAADRVVLYAEQEDLPLKGALVEIGIALGLNKPVYVVAPGINISQRAGDHRNSKPLGSWVEHPLVVFESSVRAAVGLPMGHNLGYPG